MHQLTDKTPQCWIPPTAPPRYSTHRYTDTETHTHTCPRHHLIGRLLLFVMNRVCTVQPQGTPVLPTHTQTHTHKHTHTQTYASRPPPFLTDSLLPVTGMAFKGVCVCVFLFWVCGGGRRRQGGGGGRVTPQVKPEGERERKPRHTACWCDLLDHPPTTRV